MSSSIPDADKKLSYDCLKCVIQKFEVNFRFQLAKRLPKISPAEKAVPLYISDLSVSGIGFTLNNTEYRLGVIQQAREGPTLEAIKRRNGNGGWWTDIDRFGFEKDSLPELTPGDILIQDYRPEMELNDNLKRAEARLATEQKRLADLEREKMEMENAPENRGRKRRRRNQVREEQLERINAEIRPSKVRLANDELAVLRFQCQRDDRPLPYDTFIQLTKKSPDGTVSIERITYNKSLKEALKYLICELLGNRQLVTKIKSLGFWPFLNDGLVISLPEGVKLDVQEFATAGNLSEVLQRVESILEYPNRPFARLISDSLSLEDVQNPKVREAGILEFEMSVDVMAFYREITNKKVVIRSLMRGLLPDQYAMIVENLINTKGILETCYEFEGIRWETKARDALKLIAERYENAVFVGERLVTIPLPNQLQLDVSYEPYLIASKFRVYNLKVEVVQSRSD
ncbi:unnamed protein product [Caenorhabditis nigoni]